MADGATLTKAISGLVLVGVLAGLSSPSLARAVSSDVSTALSGDVATLITSQLAPMPVHQGLVAMLLLYRLRNVERLLGSNKAAVLLVLAVLVGAITSWSALIVLGEGLGHVAQGPLGVVSTLLGVYMAAVPAPRGAALAEVCGVVLTTRTVAALGGIFLAAGEGLSSAVPVALGVAFGLVYGSEMLPAPVYSVRCPVWLSRWCGQPLEALIGSEPPGAYEARRRAAVRREQLREDDEMQDVIARIAREHPHQPPLAAGAAPPQRRQAGAAAAADDAGVNVPARRGDAGGDADDAADDDDDDDDASSEGADVDARRGGAVNPVLVDQLVAMGFDRARATDALRHTGNDVDAAVARLIE